MPTEIQYPTVVVLDAQTGEETERRMTPAEVALLPAYAEKLPDEETSA